MSLLELYHELEAVGKLYEQVSDALSDKFRSLLSNSVAKCVDYPIVEWDVADQAGKIIISTQLQYAEDLERDLDAIKCIRSYTYRENDNGTWRDYTIYLDYQKLLKRELGLMI